MSENAMHAIRSEEADRWVTEFKCAENEDRVFIVRVIEHSPLRWYFSLDSRTSSPEVTAGISIGRSFSDAFFQMTSCSLTCAIGVSRHMRWLLYS